MATILELNAVNVRNEFCAQMRPYVQMAFVDIGHSTGATLKYDCVHIDITAVLNANYEQPTLLDALRDALQILFPEFQIAAVTFTHTLMIEGSLCADRPAQLQIILEKIQ